MNRETQIEVLLDRWEEAREDGIDIPVEELCQSCPELIETLQPMIDAIKKVDLRLNPPPVPIARPADHSRPTSGPIQVDTRLVDLSFHDRGGLGIVYKAHDHKLHRDVAVKVLNQNHARNASGQQRFQAEAEITGRLDHPGVVPVYALGQTDDGQPFYVMRFIRGETFDDRVKQFHKSKHEMSDSEQRVAMRKLLTQMVSVCQTIAYAHTRGIVHRDIKPRNIMCGKHGETLVVDWGLAIPFAREGRFRVEDEKTLVPITSHEIPADRGGEGTPVFMSPEQALGRSVIGPASDIYSLGLVLYKTITGALAFDGANPIEIKTGIMKGEFVAPRNVDRDIAGPLEAICLKAMALLPSDRYETATAMADDLERYLADAPVQSYRYTWQERSSKFIRRNQTLFASILIGSVLLTAVSLAAASVFLQNQRQSHRALAAAQQSQQEILDMACRMSARTIQFNLESRLMALEELALNPRLLDVLRMETVEDDPDSLRRFLARHRDAIGQRLPSSSWLLLNETGQLVARVADDDESRIPPDFNHWTRPYFHGEDEELDSGEAQGPQPLTQPYLSPVFYDQDSGLKLCSLSVPVRNGLEHVAGVLVMNIPMGQFDPLIEIWPLAYSPSSQSRFTTLVETRGALKGSVLHHPGLSGLESRQANNCIVSAEMLATLARSAGTETEPQLIEDYADPVGGPYAGDWNTVALPVQIRSSDGSPLEFGWFLLVQSRPIQFNQRE